MPSVTETAQRDRFRAYALDGALQFFHPDSGTHVRLRSARTRHLRKASPRVVMFGITNQCNLACSFCSRDQRRPSLWSIDSAFETLRDLAAAGALEVAFGGGEPFVFPGFDALVARLYDETPLALHVTTNGPQLDRATWPRYAGRFGQVRVSVYGDVVWRRCAELFAATDQRWGANLLVDDSSVDGVSSTLRALADAGCHDVSLLGYVGEPSRLLSPRARAALAELASASPIPCRVSVCFGSFLPLPRLLAGFDNDGDCGAGSDFITVTPDQRVQACAVVPASRIDRHAPERPKRGAHRRADDRPTRRDPAGPRGCGNGARSLARARCRRSAAPGGDASPPESRSGAAPLNPRGVRKGARRRKRGRRRGEGRPTPGSARPC